MKDIHDAQKNRFRLLIAETEAQKRIAYRLRHQVMVEEMGYSVPGTDRETGLTEEADENSRVFIAYDGDTPVATTSIDWWKEVNIDKEKVRTLHLDSFADAFSQDSVFIFRKAAVLPGYRATTVFWHLVQKMGDTVLRLPVSPVFFFLDCNPLLSRLYRKLGFRTYAPPFAYSSGDMSMPMCAAMNDVEYLRESKSLMYEVVLRNHQPHIPEVKKFFTPS